ncbi:TIGR03752 family integrating conjugative element protein [Yersinia aldovae]|uniref:Integrating conjugative element protein, PFL_4705 family n=1 Tax=Yersinia aldovae TaxID=29483 RepID=A0ABP1YVF5_YERAL|nr:TIGR03752 family integrating conjugative element protein [Yersinia aldovae]CNL42345.1 integrating conjugative element protein%2C PFL_4705 family [Yersinia aldovae]
MNVKSNLLVKLAVPLTILAAALIGVKACSNRHEHAVIFDKTGGVLAELTPEDLKAMGIEGDTPQDTLRTLVGSLRAVTGRQNQLDAANKALADENKNLKQLTQNVEERINQVIADSQANADKAQVQEITSQISVLMQALKDKGNHSDIPVGPSLSSGIFENTPLTLHHDGLQWVEPNDGVVDVTGKPIGEGNNAANGFTFATSFLDDNVITRQKAELVNKTDYRQNFKGNNVAEEPVEPVFTLPENSTLIGSRAMTALLGRVPLNGKVTDPYPFKVLIGKDNLTANGIDLPDVQGAIVSGTATGDWTLSCVRGAVASITFVFTDGTVRTLPHPTDKTEKNSNQNNSIGWLSDENGIPCLSGERKSNASTYLPTLFALSASSAAGDALAQNQNVAQTNANGGVASRLTGDAGKVLMGKAISGGMQETAEWVKARYGQTFDAVYVPPGSKVAVHITRQLTIDYEEKGRKVKYGFSLSQPGTGMD